MICFNDLDSGISYNSAPPAIQSLLDKVKARKKKNGETDTNKMGGVPGDMPGSSTDLSSLLDNLLQFSIHINPKNKGKFDATKKKTGESTEELEHSKNPKTRKRAVFAANAAKWNHKMSSVNNVIQLGVKSIGTSPLGMAITKSKNARAWKKHIVPPGGNKSFRSVKTKDDHIEDIAHGLSRFRFISGQLDDIIRLGSDPRPRNPLGEFSGQEEGGPDPNAMVKTYRVAPAQPGMQPNANPQANQGEEQQPGVFGKIAAAIKNFRK